MATRWGIAGAGNISHDFVTAVTSLLSAAEHQMVAVAARDLLRAKKFADLHKINVAYGSYQELAADESIEVVYVGTLQTTHLAVSKMMLNAGKHVVCEKPLTMNLKQSKELIELAKSKNLFFMEALWSRFFPIYDTLREAMTAKSIGEIKQVVAGLGFDISHVVRLNKRELGGGTILDFGNYAIQLALLAFDHEYPVDIKAIGHVNDEGIDTSMSASLKFKDNRTATIFTQGLVEPPNDAQIIGTKGTIHIQNFWCPTKIEMADRVVEVPLPEPKHKLNFINSVGLGYEAAEVRRCLRNGLRESPKMTHAHSLMVAEIQDEIRRQVGVTYDADM